jgi:3-phenylpropionate/trans-cinnamate dioxygenase ferredoxin reductase component
MSEPIVIVGAGQAAAQAAASLRAGGYDGGIILYGDEPYLPYQRPPLSKAFLAGETTAARLELKPASFYADQDITLRLGCRVTGIDVAGRAVLAEDGTRQRFGKLLLATGTRARSLPLPGHALQGVHHIRAIRDVERLRAEFAPGARLIVIGGGYIGLEIAAKSRALGLDVTVIEGQSRILSRVVAPETAAVIAALHARNGVLVKTGMGVSAILGKDRVTGVETGDGAILPADLVLIAVGAVPNMELAAASGIATGKGILVDAATRTHAPDIHAAGDVAAFPSRLFGHRLRLESVQNAIDQAKAAASAMLGEPVEYDPVPWFWSDQFEAKLQIAGLSQGYTHVERDSGAEPARYCLRYFAGDRLIAVDTLNDPRSHMLARRELAAPPLQVAEA